MSESESRLFNGIELGNFEKFAETFFKIAQDKYSERNFAVGMAAGYLDDQGIVHALAKMGNPLGRHSWTSPVHDAMGHLVSTLAGKSNKQYGGVLLFEEGVPSCISVSSSDGRGPEEKDSARDQILAEEILAMVIKEINSTSEV